MVGSLDAAWDVVLAAIGYGDGTAGPIGSGESRTAYLHDDGNVYKVGRDSANVYEYEVLSAWRAAGARWAPETSLWIVDLPDSSGGRFVVVAMPYLPDDGDPDADQLEEIRRVAPQTWRGNLSVVDGRVWLIDGGDVEVFPELVTS